MTLDLHDNSSRTTYFITFTTSCGDFPDDFNDSLVKFHVKRCDMALLVQEGGPGEDKHRHYHSVGSFKASKTNNITNQCKTFYKHCGIEVSKQSIVVKKVPVLVGMFGYLLKHCEGPPLLVMGWQLSWIKEQIIANVSKIPHKVLMKNKHVLSSKTATALVVEYAKAKSLVLADKLSFVEVVSEMTCDGYQFEAVKPKWLYVQVMAVLGHRGPVRSLWLNELQFLD